MRFVAISVAALVVTLASPCVAQTTDPTVLTQLPGRWHCVTGGKSTAERYYVIEGSGKRVVVYGRKDVTLSDGRPSLEFEHLVLRAGAVTIEAPEGTTVARVPGAPDAPTPPAATAAPDELHIDYTVDGDTMRRIAVARGKTLDDEQCRRVEEPPFPTTCAQPNARARTLHAEAPDYPLAARGLRSGQVVVLVRLDQHSRVYDARIFRSSNAVFNRAALGAAVLSTYQTEVRDCRPVAADYLFGVDFSER